MILICAGNLKKFGKVNGREYFILIHLSQQKCHLTTFPKPYFQLPSWLGA